MVSRRSFLQGVGAFVAAATSYEKTEAGILMPTREIISEPVGTNIIFDGYPIEMSVESRFDSYPIRNIYFRGNVTQVIRQVESELHLRLEHEDISHDQLMLRPKVRVIICMKD